MLPRETNMKVVVQSAGPPSGKTLKILQNLEIRLQDQVSDYASNLRKRPGFLYLLRNE